MIMALELRQQLKLTQQLIMTPQLQMAIKLLQLNRMELVDTIRQELEENPALEEVQEASAEEVSFEEAEVEAAPLETMREVHIDERNIDGVDWSNYIEEYSSVGRMPLETEKKDSLSFESFVANKPSLQEHLLWQLLMTNPSTDQERIGSLIAGHLNRDGYLETPLDEICSANDVDLERAVKVLALMQTFDPIGVCGRNLSESLLIQARHWKLDNTIVTEIINHHLNHLENKNYKAICKALKVGMEEVAAAVNVIIRLEPRPGRVFSDEEPQYINPDIFVYKMGDEFVIMVNDDGMPRLRVNNLYKNVIKSGQGVPAQAKEYVQEKMRSAAWLIRSIHQRKKTIYRVMESILKFQKDFFEKGIEHLRPMVLREVAEDIGMHESTISRVTTNKYAHTPQGIFELKYFFNSSIRRINGDAIASVSVQDKIKQIIENESPNRPLSDQRIAKILKASNINIARRTVAKYREMLRLLPSGKRKRI